MDTSRLPKEVQAVIKAARQCDCANIGDCSASCWEQFACSSAQCALHERLLILDATPDRPLAETPEGKALVAATVKRVKEIYPCYFFGRPETQEGFFAALAREFPEADHAK